MPGTPPTSPNFGAPRYSDADPASFSAQVNAIVDTFDAKAVQITDSRLADARNPLPNSVVAASIPNASITGSKLAAATITEANLAPGSVGSPELIDGGVQNIDLASNAVDARVIGAGAIQDANLGAAQITIDKLAASAAQALNAPGDLIVSAASTRPGAVLCNGAAYSRTDTTYAALFAAIGTAYGAGDGSSTFNVPDMRGRALVAAGAGTGLTNRALGVKFGEENHSLIVGEMPNHAHGVTDPSHGHSVNDPGHYHATGISAGSHELAFGTQWTAPGVGGANTGISDTNIGIYGATTGITLQNTGGSGAHNNIQPSVAMNVFIKL